MVTVSDVAARTGFDVQVVAKALEALDPVYVDFRKTTTGGDPRFWYVFKVTPEARRAVGQWPSAESLASRLAAELAAAAQQETNGERQGLLAYAARLIGDTLRDATVRAAREVLAPAFGGVPQPGMGAPVPEPPAVFEQDFPGLVPLPELPELLRPQSAVRAPAGRPEPEAAPDPEAAAGPEAREAETGAAPQPERAAASEPEAAVPDLNPWPEPGEKSEPDAAAQSLQPLPTPTPFPHALTRAWSTVGSRPTTATAADDDPDSADTDLDVVGSAGDAASSV